MNSRFSLNFFLLIFLTGSMLILANTSVAKRTAGKNETLVSTEKKARLSQNYKECQNSQDCYGEVCTEKATDNIQKAGIFPVTMPAKTAGTQKPKGTIVLVHGLSDSPFTFHAMATELSNNGYNVVMPVLSGHSPDSNVNEDRHKHNWRQDVENAMQDAKKMYPNTPISLGGFSTGGLAALDYFADVELKMRDPKVSAQEKESLIKPATLIQLDPAIFLTGKTQLLSKVGNLLDLKEDSDSRGHSTMNARGGINVDYYGDYVRKKYQNELRKSRKDKIETPTWLMQSRGGTTNTNFSENFIKDHFVEPKTPTRTKSSHAGLLYQPIGKCKLEESTRSSTQDEVNEMNRSLIEFLDNNHLKNYKKSEAPEPDGHA